MKAAVKDKNWKKAKTIYDKALTIAVFIEPNTEEYIKIWGNSPYVDDESQEKPGWFDRKTIMKISDECVKLGIESIMFPIRIPAEIKNSNE